MCQPLPHGRDSKDAHVHWVKTLIPTQSVGTRFISLAWQLVRLQDLNRGLWEARRQPPDIPHF